MWLRKLPYFTRSAVFALFALGLTAFLEASDVFRRIDSDLTITNSCLPAPKIKFDHVVVTDVDEQSMTQLLTKLGSWPLGFNNIILHQDDLGREQRVRNGEIVDRSCQNMLSLVNNLLDQAKLEAGQTAIQRNPERVRNVISDALATVTPLVLGKPVKLRMDDQGVPVLLSMDAFRLRQIVLNLLSNAIKFTQQGEIRVTSSWRDDVLTVAVNDKGPGMPEAVIQRLFGAWMPRSA